MTATRLATYFHVHLVSDSTGETLNAMARAVCARFDNVLPIEHIYALVRSQRQLERALGEIEEAPGVVLHTIVDQALRAALEKGCRKLDMPCIPALDPLVLGLSRYLGAPLSTRVGAQYALDTDYFNRMDALNYAIGHDDGQGGQDLEQRRRGPGGRLADLQDADLHLPGPPRACGRPMCRWCRAAQCRRSCSTLKRRSRGRADRLARPADPDPPQPAAQPEREPREHLRRHRRRARRRSSPARRLFERQGWPVIDVTRRSVEETAAAVINILTGGRGQVEVLG